MLPLRLVLDTNVVVSAALKPDGVQRTVLLLALTRPARLYISVYLVTGNLRHFPRFWKKTKIISSREMIDLVAPHLGLVKRAAARNPGGCRASTMGNMRLWLILLLLCGTGFAQTPPKRAPAKKAAKAAAAARRRSGRWRR